MVRLTTFGGVALTRDGSLVVGAATAQRRLALLVLLAGSGERGISRDALAALMWPDSDAEDARHSLHQVLYTTRQAIGADDLFLGSATLHLNPARVECDVWEFEAALRTRQLELAATLYRGPFADGFSVRNAPEIERRLDALRAGFARDWASAVESLARAAAERRDHAASARWWYRLAEEDRLSARAARELIAALVASGEPVRALQFALVHEALVRQETGRPPDAEIAQWIQRLRADHPEGRHDTPSHGAMAVPSGDGGDTESLRRRQATRLAGALGRHYRLERLLEEGSIITSYAAVATAGIGREVEVHLLQPRVAAMSNVDRFVASLRRAASLTDPHVLPTFDVTFANDLLFFVGARRGARSLRERLRRERALPIRDALAIGRAITLALAHAHERDVHHGDLRPKHVSFVGDTAVIGGFGVADGLCSGPESGSGTTMIFTGSPSYLSPEQLSGEVHVDARSDVYAFGCILYHMLAGEPPLGRRSHARLISRKLWESPPPLRLLRANVPERIEEVVGRCLMPVPADRYASGGELAQTFAALEAPT